ncbi:MAG TPA: cytochrome P450 [Acidimicrobiia bacterium]|nr:cytochrome P450 [Acidimicrobiia bacterium]
MGADAPTSGLDLWSREVLVDPWDHFREIRDTAPAVYIEQYEVYAVGRFRDVRGVLRDWQTFTSADGVAFNDLMNEAEQGTAPGTDPPEHDAVRSAMLERLRLTEVRGLAEMVQGRADAMVAELLERRSFDVVTDLAQRYVTEVVGELIGIEGELLARFGPAGPTFFDTAGPPGELVYESFPVALELLQEIGRLSKDDMAPGSMGRSLFEAEERGEIPADSTTMLIWNYIGPAFDTTINGIGSTVWALARDPEQWKILKDDPSLIPSAFNEGLRLETPISIWARGCRHGAEIDGITIPPGSRMAVLIASANRDERHYPDPDHYDVRRDPHDHVAFGHGIHSCVGSSLARTEAHAVLTALVNQVTTMECGEPVREPHNTTRGLAGLPMEIA